VLSVSTPWISRMTNFTFFAFSMATSFAIIVSPHLKNGMMEYWNNGMMEQWNIGMMEQWNDGMRDNNHRRMFFSLFFHFSFQYFD
jgi:hypothetical protein